MELWMFKMALQRKIKHKCNPNDGKKIFFYLSDIFPDKNEDRQCHG